MVKDSKNLIMFLFFLLMPLVSGTLPTDSFEDGNYNASPSWNNYDVEWDRDLQKDGPTGPIERGARRGVTAEFAFHGRYALNLQPSGKNTERSFGIEMPAHAMHDGEKWSAWVMSSNMNRKRSVRLEAVDATGAEENTGEVDVKISHNACKSRSQKEGGTLGVGDNISGNFCSVDIRPERWYKLEIESDKDRGRVMVRVYNKTHLLGERSMKVIYPLDEIRLMTSDIGRQETEVYFDNVTIAGASWEPENEGESAVFGQKVLDSLQGFLNVLVSFLSSLLP